MIKKSQCELFFQFSNQHFHSVAFCQQRQTCQAIYVESLRRLCTYNQFTLTHSLTTTLVRWREGAHIKAHCNLPCIEEVTDLVIRETSKVRQTGYISFYLPILSWNLQCCTDVFAHVCCFHCPLLRSHLLVLCSLPSLNFDWGNVGVDTVHEISKPIGIMDRCIKEIFFTKLIPDAVENGKFLHRS